MPTTLRRSSKPSTSGTTRAVTPRLEPPPEHRQRPVPRDGSAARLLTERLSDCADLQWLMRHARLSLNGGSSRRFREGLNEIETDLGDYIGLLEARALQLDWRLRFIGAEPEPEPEPELEPESVSQPGAEAGTSLPDAIAAFTGRVRGTVEEMDRLGDVESTGILAEVARVADTWLWWWEVPPPDESAGALLPARERRGGLLRG
jgi:hypothetical protein